MLEVDVVARSIFFRIKKIIQTITQSSSTSLAVLLFYAVYGMNTVSAQNRDEVVFFFNDALGSAVAAVSENGDLCWSEHYTPYGDKTINHDVVNLPGCGIVGEERGFTGHTEDFNSDLVYMQQRYYDPTIGRFLSIDPRAANPEDPKTYNRYAYANNNPYKYTDPDGEFAFLVPVAMFVGKEIVAEMASRATGGATDLFSARRMASAALKRGAKTIHRIRKSGCSFASNMQVLTADGYRAITEIEPGVDKVWSKNERTGEMLLQPVLAALYDDYDEAVYLELTDDASGATQTIISNRVHPYFVQRAPVITTIAKPVDVVYRGNIEGHPVYKGGIMNGHWIMAAEVSVGDRMLGEDNSWHHVVSARRIERPITAYNIDVANTDNYFIRGANSRGSTAVWVHNCSVPNSASTLHERGLKPAPGTRVRPEGIPDSWKVRQTDSGGGVEFYNPTNRNESVRIMQGNPNSPYPNSQGPYARQRDASGTFYRQDGLLSSEPRGGLRDESAHIPLQEFEVR